MRSKHYCFRCGLLLVLIFTTFWGQAYDFPSDKQTLLDQVGQNPLEVQKAIDAILSNQIFSAKDEAEYQYILFETYYAAILGSKALEAGLVAVDRAEAAGLEELKQWSNSSVARAYDLINQADSGIPYAEEALSWARANRNLALEAHAMVSLGSIYLTNGAYSLSLEYFNDAYRLAQANTNNPDITPAAHVASFIALVYEYRHESEQAIPYFKESAAHYRRINDQVELSNSLYGLGKAYRELGKVKEALIYYNESMEISRQIGDLQGAAYTAHELATIKLGNKELTEQEMETLRREIEMAIQTFEEGSNFAMQVNSKLLLITWYTRKGDYETALEIANSAWQISQENGITPHDLKVLKTKAIILSKLGDYQKAFELMLLHSNKYKAFIQKTDVDKYQKLRAKFELDQKDSQNKLLVAQNAQQQAELNISKQERIIVVLVVIVLLILFIGIALLYAGAKRQQKITEKFAQTDELTGLCNRRQTMALVEREMKLAHRQHLPISLALADIDDFKFINDTYGHQVGDGVLEYVGKMATRHFRDTDIIGRIGGEEFLFVFPATESEKVAVSLQQFMDECKTLPDGLSGYAGIKISFSVGLVNARESESVNETLARADKLMYQAKESGKDRVVRA